MLDSFQEALVRPIQMLHSLANDFHTEEAAFLGIWSDLPYAFLTWTIR